MSYLEKNIGTVADRVKRGAGLLDEFSKIDSTIENWRSKIDIGSLNMHSPTNDILGQLFGTFREGWQKLYSSGLIDKNALENTGEHINMNGIYGVYYGFDSFYNEFFALGTEWIGILNNS